MKFSRKDENHKREMFPKNVICIAHVSGEANKTCNEFLPYSSQPPSLYHEYNITSLFELNTHIKIDSENL